MMDIYTVYLDTNNPATYVKKIPGAADTHGVKDIRTTSRSTRARRIVAAVASCYALALWVAPAAHAGPLDTTTEVTGVVGDTTSAVVETITQPVSDSSSSNDGGGTVGGTVGQVNETVGGTTKVVTETVEETVTTVTDTLDDATGGGTKPVSDVTKETVKQVGQYGDSVTDRAAGTIDTVGGLKGQGDRSGQRDRDARAGGSQTRGDATSVLGNRAEQGSVSGSVRERATLTSDGTSTVATSTDESIVQQIGRIAAEAAKQMAFPLALTLLVGAFLTMQNRMDRKDPKLALAPVDSEHDLLTFS